ncbi:NADH dehydrogenase FAD-containing subunit [Lipingzhangella halophila]|uniref:NADH dehydrogenase FAD-containing subunit n=1 Tax=Lipingzhangella halophila TaxID=1783352 RepID=A0A7W7RHY5_9ACTN|nr:FAD-dependent oxidoreductase [Lipingzhangella halophila]MBB4932298.1 NADH dehydrogenase FAD-containing subunit [Lipingzhangella halophila]
MSTTANAQPTVAVVGGGYGGVRAAQLLDEVANVVLVEPKNAFFHNAAALRGLVDHTWAGLIFLPYTRLLRRGRVIHDQAIRVTADGVELSSGDHVAADYTILATGSTYPFPAKAADDDAATARAQLRTAHDALANSQRVLLLGAGPVGIELAGEITAVWPDKAVTIVDPAEDVLSGGYSAELRDELRQQLLDLGVDLRLGTALRELPATPPAVSREFEVHAEQGEPISADIWYRCFGAAPTTGYLEPDLSDALQSNGLLRVTPELRVAGQERVFAIGDITAVPEPKQASQATVHGEVAAANITALIRGEGDLTSYEPEEDPAILVPLGPDGGASQLPDGTAGAQTTAAYKGKDLLVSHFRAMFDLERTG